MPFKVISMIPPSITIYFKEKELVDDSSSLAVAMAWDYAQTHRITVSADMQLWRTPAGKPYLSYPQIKLSLSDSGQYWLAAFSVTEIGVDLQQHIDCRKEALAQRFFHTDEYHWLQNQHFDPFFAVWAAKESYAKYTGEGLTSFKHFSVVDGQGIAKKINNVELILVPFQPGYTLAVCADVIADINIKRA